MVEKKGGSLIKSLSSTATQVLKSFKSGSSFEEMKAVHVNLKHFEDVLREHFGLGLRQTSTAGPRGQEHLKILVWSNHCAIQYPTFF